MSFRSIYVTYRGAGFHKWIKHVSSKGVFRSSNIEKDYIEYTKGNPVKVRMKDSCFITILYRPKVLPASMEVREASIKEVPCIEIESLKGKSLDEYFKLNLVILDFLNFIIPEEVHVESLHGITENGKEEEIPYPYAISKMFKPTVRTGAAIFPYNEVQRNSIQILSEKYLNKWFELSKTPLINLYCAVMYNPDMYMEYLFLGLAQAIESYHMNFFETKSAARVKLEKEINEVRNILPDKAEYLDQVFKDCYRRPYIERVREVYQEYSALADQFLRLKGAEEFSRKVKDTRHYLTHWVPELEKKAAHGSELVFLTKDLQFLLQLCIMTQLGFTNCDFTNIYHTDKA